MIGYTLLVALCAAPLAGEPADQLTADEMPDCGVTCVYGALKECGRETSLSDIEQRFLELDPDADLSKLNLAQIRRAIESFGLHARSVRVDLRYPESIPTPAILYIDRNEFGEAQPSAPEPFYPGVVAQTR
jgi:ABC-type bacteriocin/lantibiotic exporter with double-glycine peptidase domain